MKSTIQASLVLALTACAGLAVGTVRAEDKKNDPPPKAATAAPAKPAAAPVRPAAAPVVRPAVVQQKASTQLKTLHADTQSRGAYAAGGTAFDGRKAPPPAVKANPNTYQKSAAQIAKEQNAIPRAQYKVKKTAEPPSPVSH